MRKALVACLASFALIACLACGRAKETKVTADPAASSAPPPAPTIPNATTKRVTVYATDEGTFGAAKLDVDVPADWKMETSPGTASFFEGDEPMSAVHLTSLGCTSGESISDCVARWKKTQHETNGERIGEGELRFEGPDDDGWGVGFRRWLFGADVHGVVQCSASASKKNAAKLPLRKAVCETMRVAR